MMARWVAKDALLKEFYRSGPRAPDRRCAVARAAADVHVVERAGPSALPSSFDSDYPKDPRADTHAPEPTPAVCSSTFVNAQQVAAFRAATI
jgi:hypothetical protein